LENRSTSPGPELTPNLKNGGNEASSDSLFNKTNQSSSKQPQKGPRPKINEIEDFLLEQGSYFESVRQRSRKITNDFSFENSRINNSPYVIVEGAQFMQVVKRGQSIPEGFKHLGTLNMKKTLPRRPFHLMGEPVNEQRFNLPEGFTDSKFLTTNPQPKSVIPFQGFKARDANLIAKGGNSQVVLKDRSDKIYDLDSGVRT